jgi:hypothetical protein
MKNKKEKAGKKTMPAKVKKVEKAPSKQKIKVVDVDVKKANRRGELSSPATEKKTNRRGELSSPAIEKQANRRGERPARQQRGLRNVIAVAPPKAAEVCSKSAEIPINKDKPTIEKKIVVEEKAKVAPIAEKKQAIDINKEKVAPKPTIEKKVIVEEKTAKQPEKEAAPLKVQTPKARVEVKKEVISPKTSKETPPAAQSQSNSKTYLTIDFPIEDEKVQGLHYAIRIGSSNEGRVEISFNGGQWNPCRFNSGYWWFDWGWFMRGDYKIIARMVDGKGGIIIVSQERRCKVW